MNTIYWYCTKEKIRAVAGNKVLYHKRQSQPYNIHASSQRRSEQQTA